MGMFGNKASRLNAIDAKMQRMSTQELAKASRNAVKSGLNIVGTIAVAQGSYISASTSFLLVYPDRVDLVNLGRGGVMIGKDAGTESIPIARISSVQCSQLGGRSELKLFTSGNTIEFKTDFAVGPYLRQLISGLLNQALNPTPAVVSSPVVESLAARATLAPAPLVPLAQQPSMPPRTPGMVTWAFVLSLLGGCGITAVIALVLGFVGRREAKKVGAGVGLATASIVISLCWIVPIPIAIIAGGFITPSPTGTRSAGAGATIVTPTPEKEAASAPASAKPAVTKRGGLSKTGFERLSLMKYDIDGFLTAIQSDDAVAAVSMCSAMSSDYNRSLRLLSSTSPEYEEKISGMGGILDNFYSGMKDCEDAFGGDGLDVEALASSIASFQSARSMLVSMVASAKSQK